MLSPEAKLSRQQSPYSQEKLFQTCECKMCEFNVVLNGKTVLKDVVYAKTDGNIVIVKNVLGETKELQNCKISEVDVNSTRLILAALKP
jgi:predicted RNA-binding protein